MNIAVFTKKTTFHSGYGGMETQNQALCEGLARRGHSVTVFSPKWEVLKESEQMSGVDYEFVNCSFRSLAGFDYLDKNNWVNRSVGRFKVVNDRKKFDIVLAQSSAGLGIIREKDELGIRVVSISHGSAAGEIRTRIQSLFSVRDWIKLIPDLAYFFLNFFRRQRVFVLNSDMVVAVSNAVKGALLDETFIPEDRVKVIYNGANLYAAGQIETEKDIDVLYVGLVSKTKGLDDLAKALSEKFFSETKTVIVGEGDFLQELKYLAPGFEYLGRVEQDKVYELMRRSKIFVLPSRRWEGLPMTLIEAAFMGLPAVGSDMGGIPEVIEDGKTGLVYKAGNIPQLIQRLSKVLSDEDLQAELARNAQENAQEKFSLDRMLDEYEKVMEKVLK